MRKPISQERIDLANQVQSLAKNYTSKEVAVIVGKSQPYIKSLAQDFGIGFFQPKLDDHDIYLIREVRRRYGLPLAEIGFATLLRRIVAVQLTRAANGTTGESERIAFGLEIGPQFKRFATCRQLRQPIAGIQDAIRVHTGRIGITVKRAIPAQPPVVLTSLCAARRSQC